MITELFYLAIALFGVFLVSQIPHELCHYWLSKRKGGHPKIQIWLWHNIPSMRCLNGTDSLFYFAGVLNAFVLVLFGLILYLFWLPVSIALFVNANVQLFYGVYEGFFINRLPRDTYMKWHYVIYVIAAIIGIILVRGMIASYMGW